MKIIICLDDKNGMLYNKRRQSKDQTIIQDMIETFPFLIMNSYSYKLFKDYDYSITIQINDDLPKIDNDKDFQFIEQNSLSLYENRISEIVVYYWNRKYPADLRCSIDFTSDRWQCIEEKEWVGSSHEKITRKRYIQKVDE